MQMFADAEKKGTFNDSLMRSPVILLDAFRTCRVTV